MLCLGRRVGEAIKMRTASGEIIRIVLSRISRNGLVQLAFDAPASVKIWREEIETKLAGAVPRSGDTVLVPATVE